MKNMLRPIIFLVVLCTIILMVQGTTTQLFKDRDSYEILTLRAELKSIMQVEEAALYAKASVAQQAAIKEQLVSIELILEDYKEQVYSIWTASLTEYRSLPKEQREAHRLIEYQLKTKNLIILENNKSDAKFLPAVKDLRNYLAGKGLPIHICNTIESAYEAEKQWMLQINMPIWEE